MIVSENPEHIDPLTIEIESQMSDTSGEASFSEKTSRKRKRKSDDCDVILETIKKTTESCDDADEHFFLGIVGEIKHWDSERKSKLKLQIRSLMYDFEIGNE